MLESAARGISRHGYGNLVLEQVARDAGYTRGALYHQFEDKQDLALAVCAWALETWRQEVGPLVERKSEPVAAWPRASASNAVFCRRDIARVAVALRLEFSGQDHAIGRAVAEAYGLFVESCMSLIEAGRESGSIPDGPTDRALALAFVGALEGTTIALAGQAPYDGPLAARAAAGVLGLDPRAAARHQSGGTVCLGIHRPQPSTLLTGMSKRKETSRQRRIVMRRLCGPLLMATGALDVLYVLVFHSRQLAAIAGDGFFNAVDPDAAFSTFDRETAFWHLMFGAMAIVLGGLIHWSQARTGTLPTFLGWSLLMISVAALVLMPFSGFWLVLSQAVMMIVAARRGRSRSGSGTSTTPT